MGLTEASGVQGASTIGEWCRRCSSSSRSWRRWRASGRRTTPGKPLRSLGMAKAAATQVHSAFAGKRKTDFGQLLKHASLPDSEANIFGDSDSEKSRCHSVTPWKDHEKKRPPPPKKKRPWAHRFHGSEKCFMHAAGQLECVNPWELEMDPDFERTEEERQREQDAEARALRAQAIALRRHATLPSALVPMTCLALIQC